MENPAWRPSRQDSRRLEAIAHHFLSEPEQAGGQSPPALAMLVVADTGTAERQLRQALERQAPADRRPRLQGVEAGQLPNFPAEQDLLLLTSGTLAGLRTAYRCLKLLEGRPPRQIGVVLADVRNQHAAWRLFRKLAIASLQFMDLPLNNLGYLPPAGEKVDATEDPMTGILRRLKDRGFLNLEE